MQKKLIALAVAGLASTAAFAQSNVTIYGVADATFDVVRASSSFTSGDDLGSMTRVSTNSSLIGFKGAEDLGNGLKAVFQFESGVSFDAGSNLATNRDSYVGLTGGFGSVLAGRLTGPTRALGASMDVFAGATGIGANNGLLGKMGNDLTRSVDGNTALSGSTTCGRSTTCNGLFDTRFNNSIAYVSPNLSGLTLTAVYVANENKTQDKNNGVTSVLAVQPTAGNAGTAAAGEFNSKGYDLGAKYQNGPILAGLTYSKVKLGDTADQQASDLRLAGAYDFGVASVRVIYDRTKMEGSGFDNKQNVWGIGGTYNVTANGKVVGQFYKASDVKGTDAEGNTGAKLFALGYEHSLSKRTLLKATYSRLKNEDNARYDYGVNAVGLNADGATLSGVQVGLRHSF